MADSADDKAPPAAKVDGRAREDIDWEAIEREYRAGTLSVLEISRRHGLAEGTIRKRAKRDGWQRDLTAKVREKVRLQLVRAEELRDPRSHQSRTERQIVDEAADTVVGVIKLHRGDIRRAATLVASLATQLAEAADYRESLRDMIEEETSGDRSPNRRVAMLRAVALPAHASTARDLSQALKNLVGLERQAFNIDLSPDPDAPQDGANGADAADNDPSLTALLTKLSKITGKPLAEPTDTTDPDEAQPDA